MKKIKLLIATLAITTLTTFPAFADWKQEPDGRWWYQNDDGSYPVNQWKEINGKQYYFGSDGYMLANTTTPDGYQVGADGAWIENSQIQLSTTTSTPTTIIGPGTYKVGTDIGAGEYVLLCNSDYPAYYSINSDSTGSFGSIIDNDNFSYNSIIFVSDGQYLEMKRCTLSPISEIPQIDYTKGNKFKVGYHIPAGEYKLQGNSTYSAYYAVLSNASGSVRDIISNDNFDGQAYVTVKDGQYLELSRCTIVSKQ